MAVYFRLKHTTLQADSRCTFLCLGLQNGGSRPISLNTVIRRHKRSVLRTHEKSVIRAHKRSVISAHKRSVIRATRQLLLGPQDICY